MQIENPAFCFRHPVSLRDIVLAPKGKISLISKVSQTNIYTSIVIVFHFSAFFLFLIL